MPGCSVASCHNWNGNTKNENIKYFPFPKGADIQKKWIAACNSNKEINLKNGRICSCHFTPDCFKDTSYLNSISGKPILKLHKNAVPTLYLTESSCGENRGRKRTSDCERENDFKSSQKRARSSTLSSCTRKENDVLLDLTNQSLVSSDMDLTCDKSNEPNRCSKQNTENIDRDDSAVHYEASSNVSQQLDNDDLLECNTPRTEILLNKLEDLKKENQELQKKLELKDMEMREQRKLFQTQLKDKVYEILSPIFTPGQIKKLLHPKQKNVKWSSEDISSAIAIRSVSPKGYRYLRKKGYPLPGLSTLRKRAAKVTIDEGVVEAILLSMQDKAKNMSAREKLCVLCFDEIHISQNIEIDKKKEKRVGPHKSVQVGMVRGLFSNWKQPIYFAYDQPLSEDIVLDVIEDLYEAGYTVCALTTDMGPSNLGLWSSLKINADSEENCHFTHPCDDSLKVFVFADAPHLLKLIRNNFFDSGFNIDGKLVTKDSLERLVAVNNKDYKIAYKLEQKHLDVKGSERQKVSFAARVFSNTTAEAVRYCGMNGYLDKPDDECTDYEECADMLSLGNNWFDVMNSKRKYSSNPNASSYGLDLPRQDAILNNMTEFMQSMRVGTHRSLLPFQKGIIVSNRSLQQLLPYLQEKYGQQFQISYIMTRRLNQDVLENFFSYLRAMGATHDKPSSLQFKYRFRWYVLGKHNDDMIIEKCNVENDEDATLIDIEDAQLHFDSSIGSLDDIINAGEDDEEFDFVLREGINNSADDPDDNDTIDAQELIEQIIEQEGLVYVAGYVAHRFRTKYPFLGEPTGAMPLSDPPTWIAHVSRGKLLYPCQSLLNASHVLEIVFNEFHGNFLSKEDFIFTKVAKKVNDNTPIEFKIPMDALMCLVRTRTYIRLRELNKLRQQSIICENCSSSKTHNLSFTNV